MEAIRNAANAASGAIWGDSTANNNQSNQSTDEPVSGKTGDTSSGEPYDAGNTDSTATQKITATDNTNPTLAGNTDTVDNSSSGVSSSGPKQTDGSGNTPGTGPIRPEHETDKTGVTDAPHPDQAFGSDKPSSSNDNSGPGPEPSVGADPASGQQNTQKHQGADRPSDEPNSDEHSRIQEAKAEAENAQNVDTSGPGPAPLSKTHGSASKSSEGGEDDDDDGPQKESHGTGTGEKYVKSSGMKADGGDFDASNPGAGKEADRLLETKGVHHEAGATAGGDNNKPDPLEDKASKPSLKEKIAAKLHKH